MMMNVATSQVANGRRLAARQLVMGTLAAIPCQVWRKMLTGNVPANPTKTGLSWSAVQLSEQDEAEYEYAPIGHAWLLIDRFVGGAMLENSSMVDSGDVAILAQIEPVDLTIENKRQQVMQVPEWLPKEGDLFALMIAAQVVLWLELVDITGQGMVGDFGKKYVLNKRDDLAIEPIKV